MKDDTRQERQENPKELLSIYQEYPVFSHGVRYPIICSDIRYKIYAAVTMTRHKYVVTSSNVYSGKRFKKRIYHKHDDDIEVREG